MYQVIDLLKRMKLGEHEQHFAKERIDGEILSECDEEVLRLELGITDKIQLAKMMNIINGIDSVQMYTTS